MRPRAAKQGAPEWMVTYSDVISLLVTFFVMLLTFSTADREKFDKARGALRGAFGVAMPRVSRLPVSGVVTDRFLIGGRSSPIGVDFPPETDPLQWAVMDINQRLKEEKFGTPITMHMLDRGVLLRVPAKLVFLGSSALFAPNGEEYLAQMALAVKTLPNQLEIINHVGPALPGVPDRYAWKLTQKRSGKVAEVLQKECGLAARRLSVGGMGDSRPLGRTATRQDDRIEITVLRNEPSR
jgi:chemotaxis protein MotB